MSRYIRNEAIGKPADFVDFIVGDFIQKHGFTLVNVNGENVYQKGRGLLEMPQYFSYRYANGVIHIEAWVKFAWWPGLYGKENDMTGFVGSIPKNAYRADLEELVRVLYQPLPGEQPNFYGGMPNGYGQPMSNGGMAGGAPNGYGQSMANEGMPNGYGQPMSNGGLPSGAPNAYGQSAPNGGLTNGMPNGYGQPVANEGVPNGYGQPMSNGGMPSGAPNAYGQSAPNGGLTNGMPNGYGQPVANEGMPNGYGQPMMNGGMTNGMPNGYGQPMANGPITVQGVDMKKRAKTGFIMSIVGALFLAFTAFVAVINRDGSLGFTPGWTIWVCSMLYAGLATGYCYRGMASSKRGLAAAGFALGIIELVVGVLMLVFGVL